MSIFLAAYLPMLGAVSAILLGVRSLIFLVLFVCAASSCLLAFLMWDSASIGFYEVFITSAMPSASMICTAIIVKYSHLKLTMIIKESKEREKTLDKYSQELLSQYQNSISIKENLEKRILKDDSFALKLQNAVSSLSSLKEGEIRGKLLEIAEEFLRAKSSAYYSYKGGRFYLSASRNCGDEAPLRIGKESGLYKAITSSSEVITVKDALKAEDKAIMACKIVGATDMTIGFIAIYDMDFLDVNYTNERLFSILCGWAGVSIEKAAVFEAKQKESRLFAQTGFFNFRYFVETLNREILLARRYKTYFAVITIVIKESQKMSPTSFNETIITVGYKIKHVFREVDSFFFNDIKGERFHIILPMTTEEGAKIALRKFLTDLDILALFPYEDGKEALMRESFVFAVTPETTNRESNIFVRDNS
ncbi:MAG TPA: GAF domain-containing protein [Campylobacterales bacterium]|nr:GAF domain-containing protein [Campylobacterales bacterium]